MIILTPFFSYGESMKVKEAIAKADALRPNAIEEDMKIRWLMEFDETLSVELTGSGKTWSLPEALEDMKEEELFMPFPKDGIYPLHLMAMIDDANEETTLYANDMTVANEATNDARRWWWRTHEPYKHVEIKWL